MESAKGIVQLETIFRNKFLVRDMRKIEHMLGFKILVRIFLNMLRLYILKALESFSCRNVYILTALEEFIGDRNLRANEQQQVDG